MARTKEFDRDTALQDAIVAFADGGYEGTSTEALLRAMGISRQSLYDTFGDKRRLYLEALQRYITDSVAEQIRILDDAPSPRHGLEAVVIAMAARTEKACLGVNAICEFGRSDPAVAMLTDIAGRTLLAALERRVAQAQAAGEVGADLDPWAAAQFLAATLSSIKLASRGGAPRNTLHDIARMALRSLK